MLIVFSHTGFLHSEHTTLSTRSDQSMEVILARPRGFCAGVERAIAIVESALRKFGAPVYVKHAIVHNRQVVERLQAKGAIFVEELSEVPPRSRVIFSAHGVSPVVHDEAGSRALQVMDATCPLVTKVHLEARRFARQDRTIFLIGHAEHVEVIGTMGEAPEHIQVIGTVEDARKAHAANPEHVAYLTQTTLSLDDTAAIVGTLRQKFPTLGAPAKNDICYATQNRQNAVKVLADQCDLVLVVGSAHSSNSNRLVEVAQAKGIAAHLVESREKLNPQWLEGRQRIGVTAGASAPEDVVRDIVDHLCGLAGTQPKELTVVEEQVYFPLPKELAG